MKQKPKYGFAVKVIFAASLGVLMGLYPLTSVGDDSELDSSPMDVSYCQHNVDGNSGIATFCQINRCAIVTGSGSNVGPCGSDGSVGEG